MKKPKYTYNTLIYINILAPPPPPPPPPPPKNEIK